MNIVRVISVVGRKVLPKIPDRGAGDLGGVRLAGLMGAASEVKPTVPVGRAAESTAETGLGCGSVQKGAVLSSVMTVGS